MSETPGVEELTKKIGPLPGYAYVLIIAVGAYAVYYWRKHSASTSNAFVSPVNTTLADTGSGSFPAASAPITQAIDNGTPASSTNAIWARNATTALVAQGSDPTLVSNALAHYLNGQPVSASEQQIVNLAITKFGAPPEGVLPVSAAPDIPLNKRFVRFVSHYGDATLYGITPEGQEVGVTWGQWAALGFPTYTKTGYPADTPAPAAPAPAPAAAPKPAPPSATLYTVVSGDSLSLIAQRFYGRTDLWTKIYNANSGAIGPNPNLIHPGLVLTIPS